MTAHVCFPQYVFDAYRLLFQCRDCDAEIDLTPEQWQEIVRTHILAAA